MTDSCPRSWLLNYTNAISLIHTNYLLLDNEPSKTPLPETTKMIIQFNVLQKTCLLATFLFAMRICCREYTVQYILLVKICALYLSLEAILSTEFVLPNRNLTNHSGSLPFPCLLRNHIDVPN